MICSVYINSTFWVKRNALTIAYKTSFHANKDDLNWTKLIYETSCMCVFVWKERHIYVHATELERMVLIIAALSNKCMR